MKYSNLVKLEQVKLNVKRLLKKQKYQSAINIIESSLVDNHDNLVILGYLGLIYFLHSQEDTAEEIWFNCLFSCDEEQLKIIADLIYETAENEEKERNFSLAAKLYQQVLEFNQNHALSYLMLGRILVERGKLDEAISCWETAVNLDSSLTIAYYYQARQWQRLKEYDRAIIAYQQALQVEQNNLNYWYNLGVCYLENNQLELAFDCQKKSLQIEPNFSWAYGELGYLSLLNQNLEEAINYWQILFEHQQIFFINYLKWLQQKKENNNYTFILIKILTNNLTRENNDLGLLSSAIANLLSQRSQYLKAIFYYQQAINNDIDLSENYYRLILCLIYRQEQENIGNYLEKIKSLDRIKYQEIINIIKQNLPQAKITEEITTPKIYQEKLVNWLEKNNLITTNFYPIYGENIIELKQPKTTEKYVDPSFQFPERILLPASFIGILPDGRFWLREDEASSAVISNDNELIGDLSPESPALSPGHPDSHPRYHSVFKANYLPPREYINGTVVVLAGLLNKVYFHWLFDILPRINLLESSAVNLEKVDYFLVDNSCNFQQETLAIFGIEQTKIIPLSFPLHIQAKQLIIPSFPGTIAWMPKWSFDYLKNKILGNNDNKLKPSRKIYISRQNSTNRRVINEPEIINLLAKYGFEAINLEQLSVKQQGQLLATAEIVIAPHGSGLSNLVFCQPQTKVIEIFSPFYVYPCYWVVSNLLNLDYYYLVGEVFGSHHFHQLIYPDSRQEDIYLNGNKLKQLLGRILGCGEQSET